MPNVQTQTLDAAGPIFSFILGGIAPVTDCHLAQVKKLLARNLRATARGSQVWAPRVARFLI